MKPVTARLVRLVRLVNSGSLFRVGDMREPQEVMGLSEGASQSQWT